MMRGNIEPVLLVSIDDGANTWTMVRASYPVFGYPNSVSRVDPVAPTLDPLTREAKVSDIAIECVDDGWLRYLVQNNRLKGKAVTVKLGSPDISEANFAPLFLGVIEEILPVPGGIVLHCLDTYTLLLESKISTSFIGRHPLECVEAILIEAGVDSSLYDATTLDPANYTSSFSHHVVHRGGYNEFIENLDPLNAPARGLLSELAAITNGSLLPGEDGVLRFVRFSSTASAVAAWTSDDIRDFKQISTYDNLTNRVICAFGKRVAPPEHDKPGEYEERYEHNDTDSQTNFAYPGASERIVERMLETQWIHGRGLLRTVVTAVTATPFTMVVHGLIPYGMSGARVPTSWPSSSQDADAQLSAGRPAYLKIDDEIFKATACTLSVDSMKNEYGAFRPMHLSYTISDRAQFGTSAAQHTSGTAPYYGVPVFDVTVQVDVCTEIIRRFSNGCPVIEVTTGLHWHAVQIGDLVTVTYDTFLAYGASGVDTNTKWEVVGKEVDASGDAPGIKWTLAMAAVTSPPAVTTSVLARSEVGRHGLATQIASGLYSRTLTSPRIEGCEVTNAGGLTIDIAAGIVTTAITTANLAAQSGIALTASKDVWITFDVSTQSFVYRNQTIGTAPPDLPVSETWIAKVVTGGAAITAVYDLRNTTELVAPTTVNAAALSVSSGVRGSTALNINPFFQD